jgi:hypothetical protein
MPADGFPRGIPLPGRRKLVVTRLGVALTVSLALLWTLSRPAAAEVFILTTGGRVEGQWLNRDETPRKKFVIQTSGGGQITLARTQVKEVLQARPEELEYQKIRPSYADTVEGQWALAEWCRTNRLTAQRETHLRRVIELDPDHVQARRALGYNQIDGKWQTQEEVMTARGYRRYNGRWLTPQEIELAERKRKNDLAEKQWAQKLKRWRDWLDSDRAAEGRKNILAINDPHAVAALAHSLQNERFPQARILYVEALANIGTPDATEALAACSVDDPNQEVRLTCLDYLEKRPNPDVVAYYVGRLRSKDNRVVNRAAVGLAHMKDPSAIGPLIQALVTVHKYKVTRGNPGAMSARFPTGNTPGGTGLAMNDGPKIISVPLTNQPVLDALVALTGQNFSFDQQAWTYWYAAQRKPANLDARRD